MQRWLTQVGRFLRDEDGPTAVEYAVMLARIITACFTAIASLGSNTSNSFSNKTLNDAAGMKTTSS